MKDFKILPYSSGGRRHRRELKKNEPHFGAHFPREEGCAQYFTMKSVLAIVSTIYLLTSSVLAFAPVKTTHRAIVSTPTSPSSQSQYRHTSSPTSLASTADLGIVALVAGQENYGLAIVALGEALWSFAQSPNFSNIKVLVPASVAAIILVVASGPMITSGEVTSVQYGLEIATVTSLLLLGASYIARLVAPYSPTAKEAAFFGLLIAIAGFFSFSQNLVVDGFITLPNLPSLPLPEMPLGLGESINTDRY